MAVVMKKGLDMEEGRSQLAAGIVAMRVPEAENVHAMRGFVDFVNDAVDAEGENFAGVGTVLVADRTTARVR